MSQNPVRFSHLRAYGRSGAHGYFARHVAEAEPTYAMQRGTAVHAMLFGTRKVCGYAGVRRGKEFEAFAAAHQDYEILTMAEYDRANRMADAVRACKLAMDALQGIAEQTLRFRWMGEECRVTPDVRGENWITELKTTASADPLRFPWHALRMHYHAQMRFQSLGAGLNIGALEHYVVAVESDEPHPVSVYRMSDRALEVGEKLLVSWMERLRQCEQSQCFPPYIDHIAEIDVPDDVQFDFEEAA